MGNRYPTPAPDGWGPVVREIQELARRLDELEVPTGTSMNSLVAQVQEAIANIGTTINAWLNANSYTKAQIDNKVANPGAIAPTTVTASGIGTFNPGLKSTDVHSRLLTYGGAYTSTYTHVDGTMGTVPSSRRFKRDIAPVSLDASTLGQLQLVTFRYIAAVENLGDDAQLEVGLIAEEVHDLGLTWLVDYDADGLPAGVKYERLALVFIPWMQDIDARLAAGGL